MQSSRIKVVVVDDSAVARQVIPALLERDPDLEVIATASAPPFALEKMRRQWPDVIVLNVERPRRDGIAFLRQIMSDRPTPVVACSSRTETGEEAAARALAAGAVGVLIRPRDGLKQFLEMTAAELTSAVKAAAQLRMALSGGGPVSQVPPKESADAVLAPASPSRFASIPVTDRVVAIGASAGGTQALEAVLMVLPRTCPGIVVVQHMPEKFTAAFAERLNSLCAIEVREAQHGDRVLAGRALIAPGGRHMLLRRRGTWYYVEVRDGPPVNRHRPSVDVLFRSVAQCAGKNALGIIMTGMGDDGARGLLEMHDAGARTIAQDEASCVVYGMPKEAVQLGAVDRVLPLTALPGEIMRHGRIEGNFKEACI